MVNQIETIKIEVRPKLRNPLMILAFRGWNDGGQSATNVIRTMIKTFDAKRFATMDPEPYYVFSENRPTVRLVDGDSRREVEWQKNEFFYAPLPGLKRDLVLFLGTEPNLMWRTYCEQIVALVKDLGVREGVTLGAFLGDVLYTLPVQINGFSSNLKLMDEHELERTSYEGPTGIVGVINSEMQQQGFQTLSLWAAVPYYISIPNPKAVLALVTKLKAIFGFQMDTSDMEENAENFDNEINDVVSKDPNIAAYVRELKKRDFLN